MKKTATFLALAVAAIFSAQAIEQTYYDYIQDDPNNYGTIGVRATDDLSKVIVWVGCDNRDFKNYLYFLFIITPIVK